MKSVLLIASAVVLATIMTAEPALAAAKRAQPSGSLANQRRTMPSRSLEQGRYQNSMESYMPRAAQDERFMKLKLAPGSLLRPGVRGDISMRIGQTGFAAGGVGEYIRFNEDNTSFMLAGGGVNGSYYFSGSPFADSWYITPSILYRAGRIEISQINLGPYAYYAGYSAMGASANIDMLSLEAIIGYQWHWDGFNLSVGAGPAYHYMTLKDIRGYFKGGILGTTADYTNPATSNQSSTLSVGGAVVELAIGWSI